MRRPLAAALISLGLTGSPDRNAAAEPVRQSITAYGGPATYQFASDIVRGHFSVDGMLIGLAYDRELAKLAPDLTFEMEVQATHLFNSLSYSTIAGGFGVRYELSRWIGKPSSFAFYTGPSYADDPGHYDRRSGHLLEYVGLEFAMDHIGGSEWNGVVRMFHRSGAFGLYGSNTDTGSMLGIGIQRQF